MSAFLLSTARSVGLALLVCLALQGCASMPGRPNPGVETPRPDAVLDFPTLYRQNCVGCHGAGGMNGPSYPLANPKYQALVSESILRQVIAQGEPGTLMPAFATSSGGTLTDAQVDALAAGMRQAWSKPQALAGANPPPYHSATVANAAAGRQVYSTYCASCHGEANHPGKAGSITDPDFLTLVGDQVLRTIVIAGRPDIGQPDWRGDLPGQAMSDREVTDVVAWLSSKRPSANAAAAVSSESPARPNAAHGKPQTEKSGRGSE